MAKFSTETLTPSEVQRITDLWVRDIMRPILASSLIDTLLRAATALDSDPADLGLDWLADECDEWQKCDRCGGEGTIDRGDIVDCPHCIDGDANYRDPRGKYVECQKCGEHACPECDGEGKVHAPIYEYWIIEDRAAARIDGSDLIAASDIGIGNHVWKRRCTGQAISLDCDIRSAALAFANDCGWWVEQHAAELDFAKR